MLNTNLTSFRRSSWLLLFLVAMLFCESLCKTTWGQGAENLLLVVNTNSADSLAIANRYVELRNIPPSNVVYLDKLTLLKSVDDETMHIKYFRPEIMAPVTKAISERGLTGQIDCIVYSAGFPTRVCFQPQMKAYLKQAGKKYKIQLHSPWCSITSLTYFRENAFSASPNFLELDANAYASTQAEGLLANPFLGETANRFDVAKNSFQAQKYGIAARQFSQLATENPDQVTVLYCLARSLAMSGEREKAIQQLAIAKSKGFSYRSVVEQDRVFDTIRNQQRFKETVDSMLDSQVGFLPSRGFSAMTAWSKNGWPNGESSQGERYTLSTVLAVTGKNKSTLKQALAQIESSVGADGTAPSGTVYFAKHADPRSRTRSAQFKFAAEELNSIGGNAVIGRKPVPNNDKQVIGATLGSAVLDWSESGSRFLPGALADNFTSYGGWWTKSAQTQLSEFLNAGAAGACGPVEEPYTIQNKIPTARLHFHYAQGCTLAEAFYQSVSGPFQLLIVGDPLCCPYGNFPKFEIAGPSLDDKVQGDFDLSITANGQGPAIGHFEVFYDGVFLTKIDNPKTFRVSTDDMNDGYHELRVVAVSDSLVANRSSQSIEFVLNQKGHSTTLVADKSRVRLSEQLMLTANSSTNGEIQIRQNSRTVAKFKSGERRSINASQLGLGKPRLSAVVVAEDGTAEKSIPLEIEVVH